MTQTEGANDEIWKFLKHFNLDKFESGLRSAGLDDLSLLKDLDESEINDIAEEAGLKTLHRKKLLKAITSVKNGSYAVLDPYAKEEKEEKKEDPELVKLLKERKNLRGDEEIKTDKYDPLNTSSDIKNRTIVMIGESGAGKTTLINSMTNYLFKVQYHEKFRYKLIYENKDSTINMKAGASKTNKITAYYLERCPAIPHSLTIIDTPGFGDTEGPQKDLQIRTMFKDFFESVPEIDAIYFVVKSSVTRLGATQKYIFDMVLNLFGDDMKNNIFILFTFADGDDPPALEQIKELKVPYTKYFSINNSGFKLKKKASKTHQSFFEMGMEQYHDIFNYLSSVQTKSTTRTVQTLRERDNIKTWLFSIGQDVKTALDSINIAHETYEFLEANKKQIEANKNFKIPDQNVIVHHDKKPSGCYTTYCAICIHTCHANCGIPDDGDKHGCSAMTDGYCTSCPKKCEWHRHSNKPYVIRRETVTVYKTIDEMAKNYNEGKKEAANCENVMKNILAKIEKTEKQIRETIVNMKNSVNRLKEIALNKNILTDDQYFDTLIQAEQDEKRKGYRNRVLQLKSLKDQNKLLRDVHSGKEPISWANNQDLKKYKQQFKQQQEIQQAPPKKGNNDILKIEVGGYKLSINKNK
eukprot:438645_1